MPRREREGGRGEGDGEGRDAESYNISHWFKQTKRNLATDHSGSKQPTKQDHTTDHMGWKNKYIQPLTAVRKNNNTSESKH